MTRRWAPYLAVLCACAAVPARAQNPKLNLRLEQVTFAEAAEALSKASGIGVQLYQPRLPPNFPPRPVDPRQLEKATFNWEGATFAKALRELSERYQVRPMRRSGSYELYPGALPAKLPEKLTGLVEQEGVRLFARSVTVHQNHTRVLNFAGEAQNFGDNAQMALALGGLLAERDPTTLAGLENVVASDDRGNRLEWRRDYGGLYGSGDFGIYPDEWSHSLSFRSPDPRARKIVSLQGDLMVYKWVRPRKVEVPLPLPEKVVKREAGDTTVVFSAYRVLPRVEPEDDKVELPGVPPTVRFRGRPPVQGPIVRVRVVSPSTQAGGYSMRDVPVVIGESGRQYRGATLGGSSSFGAGAVRVADAVYYFPEIEEPAVRIVWETVEKGEPVKLFSFRMTDIPLPPPVGSDRAAPGGDGKVQAAPEPLPDHPWAFRGGATLLGRVERLGKPAAGGTLELGMAMVAGGKAGAIRWIDVPVDSQGVVRLLQVRPGSYQVHLRYRGGAAAKPPAGTWLNSTATVALKAGQATTLAPLRWVTRAPAQ